MVAYSFKRRFVEPIQAGLKRQTIRAHGKRRHARPGDDLQLYAGMRTKQCMLIARVQCESVHRITVWWRADCMTIMVDGKLLGPRQNQAFARADGFSSPADMATFWREEHGEFIKWEGVIIRWG